MQIIVKVRFKILFNLLLVDCWTVLSSKHFSHVFLSTSFICKNLINLLTSIGLQYSY